MCERVVVSRTYKWVIDNFSKKILKHEPLVSSIFEYKLEDVHSDEQYTSMWMLKLYPNGFDDKSKGYVCVEITLHDNEYEFDLRVDCKLSILKANYEETKSHYTTLHIDSEDSAHTRRLFRNFIKLNYILEGSNGLLLNDKLTLLFSIGIQKGQNFISMEESSYKSRLQLSDEFECFYNSEKFNDVTFTVGDKEFQANKSILAARSPIFFSMFSLDMKEKKENSVNITDVDPRVFKDMLKFLYSGKLQKNQFIEELYVAADKYAIEGLQEVCEKSLRNGIETKNAIDTLQFADFHNLFDLKQHALQFIIDRSQKIIETEGFKNIGQSQVHLIKELFCALSNKYKSNENETAHGPSKIVIIEELEN